MLAAATAAACTAAATSPSPHDQHVGEPGLIDSQRSRGRELKPSERGPTRGVRPGRRVTDRRRTSDSRVRTGNTDDDNTGAASATSAS